MDILAHSLWNYAAYRAAFRKRETSEKLRRNALLAGFFGVLPDAFSFGYLLISRVWENTANITPYAEARFAMVYNGSMGQRLASRFQFNPSPNCNMIPDMENNVLPCIPQYVYQLYNFSHSLIIFGAIFVLVWLILRRPWLPLLGWGLHIVIDIFSHNNMFFPTPFLFPISDFRVNATSWANPVFMAANYSILVLVYLIMYIRKENPSTIRRPWDRSFN